MTHPSCHHVRENTGLLAPFERRVLPWLAARLPAAVNADHLSALGLISMLCAGLGFAAFRWTPWAVVLVVAALAASWFGDSLDGTVARVRGLERPRYGFYVDHVIDLAGTAFLFAGLAFSELMNPLLALMLLSAYLLVCSETYLATHVRSVFRMSFGGIGPTELRALIAAGALKASVDPVIMVGDLMTVRLFDAAAVVAIPGLIAIFAASAVRNSRALYAAEPLPSPSASRAA